MGAEFMSREIRSVALAGGATVKRARELQHSDRGGKKDAIWGE